MAFAVAVEPSVGREPGAVSRARLQPPARCPEPGVGNRSLARSLGRRGLARCAGGCACGGGCAERTKDDEALLAAGQVQLRRAVLARDGERRSVDPPPPAPTPPPAAATNVCGPDVTQQVRDVVAKTKTDFASWDWGKRSDACAALESLDCAGSAWDIVELHNRGWLTGYAPCADQTGPCRDTVMVDGSCSYAGSVNYVIFGAQCKLCDIWQSTMEDMIWAYKGPRPWRSGSANYGPSLEWARAGYHDWPAVGSPTGDRPSCTGSCPTAYTSGPLTLHWYPASATETVPPACRDTARRWRELREHPPELSPGMD